MKKYIIGIFIAWTAFSAEVDRAVASYAVSATAERAGPFALREDNQVGYDFFRPGADRSRVALVGREVYTGGVLVKRALFLEGKLHGVQRRWHLNGQTAEESPYKAGLMHGTFRRWNERGQLVAEYNMSEGEGTEVGYFDTGFLATRSKFDKNERNGLRCDGYNSGGLMLYGQYKMGDPVGIQISFYDTGEVMQMSFEYGPIVRFRADGTISRVVWYLKDNEVSEAQYATAAAKDKNLTPYLMDPVGYKNFVPEEAKVQLKAFRESLPVKIPLEFDASGQPVLATR